MEFRLGFTLMRNLFRCYFCCLSLEPPCQSGNPLAPRFKLDMGLLSFIFLAFASRLLIGYLRYLLR